MNFIKLIVFNIGRSFSYIIPLSFINICSGVYTICRSGYYQRFFLKFDNRSRIKNHVFTHGLSHIKIGKDCVIGKGSTLTAWPERSVNNQSEIIFGDNVKIGAYSHITAVNKIVIGNNVLTGKNVLITDNAHGASNLASLNIPPSKREIYSKGEVIIEDNVWIGEKVSILPGTHIGYGSIIAANSVVSRDIPPLCVVGGIPAKIIKKLD